MFSSDPRIRRALTAFVGIILLASAVFFPFGSIPPAWTHQYSVEEVTPNDTALDGRLAWIETTESCSTPLDDCALTYRVRDEGPQVVSDTTYRATRGFSQSTEVVIFRDSPHSFYQPNTTRYENDSTRLELKPISNATALALVSTPARRFPSGVQRLVAEGTIRTNHPLDGFALLKHTNAVIAYNGKYYEWSKAMYRGTMQGVEEFLRLLALIFGAVCCFRAG